MSFRFISNFKFFKFQIFQIFKFQIPGTADSTLKFMLKLMDMVEKAEKEANVSAFKEILNGNNKMEVDQQDMESMRVTQSRQSSSA